MKRVIVYHSYFGCDTGCCGHTVELIDENGNIIQNKFEFDHPFGEDKLEFVKNLIEETFGKEHIADLDWKHCIIEDE